MIVLRLNRNVLEVGEKFSVEACEFLESYGSIDDKGPSLNFLRISHEKELHGIQFPRVQLTQFAVDVSAEAGHSGQEFEV